MKENRNHEVIVGDHCTIACYCVTCRRCIFESDRHTSNDLLQADMTARGHWDAFSLHHTILVFDIPNNDMRVMTNTGKMKMEGTSD